MTLPAHTAHVEYVGNDTIGPFTYDWRVDTADELEVRVDSTVKVRDVHYTISGVGNANGGNVTFIVGEEPATGAVIALRSVVAFDQLLDLVPNSALPAESLEARLDQLVKMMRLILEQFGRIPTLREGVAAAFRNMDLPLPDTLTAVAGGKKYLSWNDAETNLVLREIASSADTVGLLSSTVSATAFGSLPPFGNIGNVRAITDDRKGLWFDNGEKWRGLELGRVNVLDWATADGVADDSSNILTAAQVTQSSGGVLHFPAPYTYLVDDNLTLPDDITLAIDEGALLEVTGGNIVQLNTSRIIAGDYQIFSGSGTIHCSPGGVRYTNIMWFGAKHHPIFVASPFDSGPAINAAIQAHPTYWNDATETAYGGQVWMPPGSFFSTEQIYIPAGMSVSGAGPYHTTLYTDENLDPSDIFGTGDPEYFKAFVLLEYAPDTTPGGTPTDFKNCSVLGGLLGNGHVHGVIINLTDGHVENLWTNGFSNGSDRAGILSNSVSGHVRNCMCEFSDFGIKVVGRHTLINNCFMHQVTTGMVVDNSTAPANDRGIIQLNNIIAAPAFQNGFFFTGRNIHATNIGAWATTTAHLLNSVVQIVDATGVNLNGVYGGSEDTAASGATGVEIMGTCNNISVTGATLANLEIGISVEDSPTDISLRNNHIIGCHSQGIVIDGGVGPITIFGNTITGMGTVGGPADASIHVVNSDNNGIVYVKNNSLTGTANCEFGLDINNTGSSSIVYVSGNDVSGHSTNLNFTGSSQAHINRITNVSSDQPIWKILTASASLDFPQVAANGEEILTLTVSGAVLANLDVVVLQPSSGAMIDGLYYDAWVSADNTVTVRAINYTGTPINPTAQTFKVLVYKQAA